MSTGGGRRVSLFVGRIRLGPYWLAVLSALLGVALRLLMDPWLGNHTPYLTFVVSVALTGLFAGVRPALFCTALGGALAYFCFVPPRYHWGFATKSDAAGFLLYLAAASGIVLLSRSRNQASLEKERSLEEQIGAERKLRDAQQLMEVFLANRPGCAYLRNEAGSYVYYNNEAHLLLGIGDTEAESEPRLKLESHDQQMLATAQGPTRFLDKLNVRGEERYWLTTKFIFANRDTQRFVGSLSIDVTSQMQADQIAIETERLASASQMVSMVAHEINNPLAAVTNLLYLLGREDLPPPARELVGVARNELARLTRIAGLAIGLYARATDIPAPIDPSRLVGDVLNESMARHSGQRPDVRRDFRWFGVFVACAGQIRQVIENLMCNALESGANEIRVRVVRSSDWRRPARSGLRVSILDNGHGMNRQQRNMAFEPFFSTKSEKGTGLGLWVAKAMTLRNAGHISLRSTENAARHGTCVSVFFPDRVAAAPSAGARHEIKVNVAA